VPLSQAGAVRRIWKCASALQQELGREATPAEIAEGMGLTAAQVATTLSVAQPPVSLDAPRAPGEETRLTDHLADDAAPSPDATSVEQALVDALGESLARLGERELTIVRLYFGLDGEEPMNLEQIGALLGITRERVRQLKERALARLRAGRLGKVLAEFY
jgi:RNA polymerase primary sigma factor